MPHNRLGYLVINDCCKIASLPVLEILRSKCTGVMSFTFRSHVTSSVSDHLIAHRPFPMVVVVLWNQASISSGFRDIQWRM